MIRLLASVLLGGVLAGSVESHAEDEVSISLAQAELVGIETSRLEQQPAVMGLRFPGRVVVPPDRTRLMNAPLGGRIERLAVRADAAVRAGDVLAELQSPALAHAQAEFLVAANKELLLKGTLDREQSLAPYGAVTKKQVVATHNEFEQARATTAERRQALLHYGMTEAAVEKLIASQALDPRLVISAPIDGVVLEISVVPGQTVEALAPICRLAQLAPLWVEIQVTAPRAADFRVGADVTLRDYDGVGRVVSLGTSVDATAQTVIVRAEFAVPGDLRPGQVVEARVAPTARAETEWRVRTGALVRRGSDAFVFVKTDSGFVARPVTVQEEMPEFAVVSGVFKGDEHIAVRGLAALKGAWQGLGGVE
ncbi:MAG: efflux RND transporter periplasmic adaptor subunit [Allosphingosinicella sp.]